MLLILWQTQNTEVEAPAHHPVRISYIGILLIPFPTDKVAHACPAIRQAPRRTRRPDKIDGVHCLLHDDPQDQPHVTKVGKRGLERQQLINNP